MRPRVRLPLACLLGIAAIIGVPAAPAHAAAYRYWSYWHAAPGSSSWTFAGSGPSYRPSPGAVEGWRFAVSQGTGSAPAPRTDPAKAYSRACGSRTPDSGQKLVALVLDYGTTSDAPPGERPPAGVVATCTQVPGNGDGFAVLGTAKVSVREKGGLVCGLNGYPRSECARVVTASPSPSTSHSASRTPSPTPRPASTATHPVASSPGQGSPHPSSSTPSKAANRLPSPSPTPTSSHSPIPGDVPVSASPGGSASDSAVIAAADPSLAVGDVGSSSSRGRPWALVAGVALLLVLAMAGLSARRGR